MIALFKPQLLYFFVVRVLRMINERVFAEKLRQGQIICDAEIISMQLSSTLRVEVIFWYNNERMSGHFFVMPQNESFYTGQKLKLGVEFFFPEEKLIVCNVA